MSTTIKKKDLQLVVQRFKDFCEDFKYEVLISYDCAGIHKPFREELTGFLEAMYGSDFINESLYLLKQKLTMDEIAILKGRIEDLFNKTVLNEAIVHDNITTVKIIYPSPGQFNFESIVRNPK